ncbi:MAG: MBL fold metallo-hydrolase [Balneolaceae bacterium]|nr:MBL fold metallo-hydrolase [Balneolaceae bacterium]
MFEFFAAILVCATFLIVGTLTVDYIIKAPVYKGPPTEHFNGKTFSNIDGIKARGLKDVIKWAITEEPGPWTVLSEEDITYGSVPESTVTEGIKITFVNHATFLIQVDGLNILTDPVWSERASPFQWIGPKRMRPPGIRFQDLPEIDVVLISHNHYDHLDIHTAKRLKDAFDPLFITPLGVPLYLKENGITNTAELNWWNDYVINQEVKVFAVPAQHFSGRGLTDRDKTLWAGYVLQTPAGNIYFAGDTGYDGFFKDIGQRFNPIDVALIPVGAYKPRWFMSPIHVDPFEAVQIHKDVGAKQSIGMHFGTFPLADDGMTEPINDLAKAREQAGIDKKDFFILNEGASKSFYDERHTIMAE